MVTLIKKGPNKVPSRGNKESKCENRIYLSCTVWAQIGNNRQTQSHTHTQNPYSPSIFI